MIFGICMLSACTSIPKPEPTVIVSPTVPLVVPKISPVVIQPVQWKVYNSTELKSLGEELAKSNSQIILFTLDSTNFQNLNLNLADIKRYIAAQQQILDFLTKARTQPK
jgi:hypothetical protein